MTNKDAQSIKNCENKYKGYNNYTLINNYGLELQKNLTEALEKVIITPVIYDEISNFKDARAYPFEKRKNNLSSNKN